MHFSTASDIMVKKKVLKTTTEADSYFVSLRNPLELRRHLLESSRKSVYALQNYQKLLLIREKKSKELATLKQSVKELLYLSKKLAEKLPVYKHEVLHSEKKPKQPLPKPAAPALEVKKPEPIVHEKTDMEKLEESLAAIESKLQKIQK